jgi:hypothetical protein
MSEVQIQPTDLLLRRICELFITKDNKISSAAFEFVYRISSSGFSNEELSVDLESLLNDVRESLKNFPNEGLASFPASVPQELNLEIKHDPKENNYAHALIMGKKTKSKRKKLAREAKWEIPLSGYKIKADNDKLLTKNLIDGER